MSGASVSCAYIFRDTDSDIIMTLLQYFVCCITHAFQLWRL